MKSILSWIPICLLLLVLVACEEQSLVEPQPRLMDKTIVFNLYTEQDFSDTTYKNQQVEFLLKITRTKDHTSTENSVTVLDTTLTGISLQDLPTVAGELQVEKLVKAVDVANESVSMSYIFVTTVNGVEGVHLGGDFVAWDEKAKVVNVKVEL